MDMDLVVIFGFIATIVLIIVGGIVLYPIAQKLGHFLEVAARERAEGRLRAGSSPEFLTALPDVGDSLARIDERLERIESRQAFVERLVEERPARTLEGGTRE